MSNRSIHIWQTVPHSSRIIFLWTRNFVISYESFTQSRSKIQAFFLCLGQYASCKETLRHCTLRTWFAFRTMVVSNLRVVDTWTTALVDKLPSPHLFCNLPFYKFFLLFDVAMAGMSGKFIVIRTWSRHSYFRSILKQLPTDDLIHSLLLVLAAKFGTSEFH